MIRSYHGFSDWIVMKLDTDDLLNDYTFGIELEVQKGVSDVPIDRMSDILEEEFGNLFVYERDGSIGIGFEIISQPMTWNYFKKNIAKFKKLFELLNNANYRSHNGNSCGLHVHIGKQGLGLSCEERRLFHDNTNNLEFAQNERIGNVATNINIQLERFRDEIHRFSRRNASQVEEWCKYLDCDIQLENGQPFINKDYIRAKTKPAVTNIRYGDRVRYRALNLCNKNTIELRLFRGTLKWTTFYYTMNLINNLVFQAKLESTVVDWKDLVFRGLNIKDKAICKDYCVERGIDLEKRKVVALNYRKTVVKTVDKRALFRTIMNES